MVVKATIIPGISEIPPIVNGLVREKNGLKCEDNLFIHKHSICSPINIPMQSKMQLKPESREKIRLNNSIP
jgi:hypothetical protein